jgi:hypothetical protein
MSFTAEDLAAVVGRRFPGGHYTIEPWRAWLIHDAILAPPPRDVAHPVFVFLAATSAMGLTWDELFGWFGATAADGPMLGDCQISQSQPLQVGASYRVSGCILGAERKSGRQLGLFDLVEYQLDLRDGAGVPAAACRNSIIFPRR